MKLRILQYAVLFSALLTSSVASAQDCQDNWLSTKGNKIVDINGTEVTLAGVNWFGFENDKGIPNGLWSRDAESVLQQIKDMGFNCIRLPWANANMFSNMTITQGSYGQDPYTGVSPMNPTFVNGVTTPFDVMDLIVQWCQANDMRVILDNHSRSNETSAHLYEPLWYRDGVTSHEEWIAQWVLMAERYKDYSAVVGMDLNNEPHGNPTDPAYGGIYATWGSGDAESDWKMAAQECGNAILNVNPNVLIIIEGIQEYVKEDGEVTNYWWGGNLQGVRDHPVVLNDPSKLVYSPHEYGPHLFSGGDNEGGVTQTWFEDENFEENLPNVWEENFNFINSSKTAPLLIGEFGIKAPLVKSEKWIKALVAFIKEQGLHYTFWCFNENSTDTGGLVTGDWVSQEEWKLDLLDDILHYDPIPNCIVYTGVNLSNEEFNAEVNGFKVFPNPTTDLVTFSSSSNNIKSVEIFDLNGKKLISSTTTFEFDLSNFATGIYLANVVSERGVSITVKVVKE